MMRALAEWSVTTVDTVHHMDALALLRALRTGSIDLIVTSPPYDNLRTYNDYTFPFEPIAHEAYRVLKQGGVMVWVVGDATVDGCETLTSMRQALYFVDVAGFKMHDTMIFAKNARNPNIHHPRYNHVFEYMFVLVKGNGPRAWNPLFEKNRLGGLPRGKPRPKMQRNGSRGVWGNATHYAIESVKSNVWTYGVGAVSGDDQIAFKHPAPFPEKLARDHILSWSNPGDVVLDFFMGSGTTAKMARATGRHYIGCDISREYVDIARARLAQPYTLSMFDTHEHDTAPEAHDSADAEQLALFEDERPARGAQ